jgi:Transposase
MNSPPQERVTRIRQAPKTAPCPHCGRHAPRQRLLHRRVRSLAYRQVAWLHVTYAEYRCRGRCRNYFRTWPLDVPPKADYDAAVRRAVLDRLLLDGLNVERTLQAMRRDFLLALSTGFVYDCLRWQVAQLDLAAHRRLVLQKFSGTLCVDELHLGAYTLLLATDPLADLPVAFALVSANDQAHMGRFLGNLKNWGLSPRVVVSDGSNLYPAVLAQLWPGAQHQLCVFHVLKDLLGKVLQAVQRLRRGQARRGRAGRRRRRGRPSKAQKAARRRQGPSAKEKASFVYKHRYLVVKRTEGLSRAEWADLVRMFQYLPELRTLWQFSQDVYQALGDEQALQVARRRWTVLRRDPEYQAVAELAEALGQLEGGKLDKVLAFLSVPPAERVRTNNHVERANRRLRFAEKVRYKWRKRRWVVRYVVLLLDVCWRQAAAQDRELESQRPPPQPDPEGKAQATGSTQRKGRTIAGD